MVSLSSGHRRAGCLHRPDQPALQLHFSAAALLVRGWIYARVFAKSGSPLPQTGAILRTIESNRFVTGVTWIDGELWHDLRRVDPRTGEVLERLEMPPGVSVSGLESDGGDQFFCGGGRSGKVRTVRRPKRGSATGSGSEIPVDSTSK